MENPSDHLIKILFLIEQDENGYPPVTIESLWAKKCPNNLYQIDNIPFYVREISYQDVVSISSTSEGTLTFEKIVTPSTLSTIRIIIFDKDKLSLLTNELEKLGCSWEGGDVPSLISVDIPPEVDIQRVWTLLEQWLKNDLLEYEDASIRHK